MRKSILFGAAAAALVLALSLVQARKPDAAPAEEAAFRKLLDAYSAAYNKGDLTQVMSFWAEGSEFVSEDGDVTRGKKALTNQFQKVLAEHKGRTMRATIRSLRLLRPDLAVLDGTVELMDADGAREDGPFTSLWTKTETGWQILSVRDLPSPDGNDEPTPPTRLQQLDWLVGEWAYKDKDTVITLACRRHQKHNFLIAEQAVRVKGEEVLSLTLVIGWDPLEQQLRCWVFDSAGGFGEGLWERKGNSWVVDMSGVRADGRTASGTNTWRYIDDNTFEWSASDREIDGEPAPDVSVRYTRAAAKK